MKNYGWKLDKYIFFKYIIVMILFILLLILYFSFYNYLDRLKKENCNCAINKDYKFIKNFTLFYVISLLIIPLFFILIYAFSTKYFVRVSIFLVKYNKLITILTLLIGIIYLYKVYKYIHVLDDSDCKCSESNIRTLMFFYSLIILIIDVVLELILIASLFLKNKKLDNLSHFILTGKKKKPELSNKNKKIIKNKIANIQKTLAKYNKN